MAPHFIESGTKFIIPGTEHKTCKGPLQTSLLNVGGLFGSSADKAHIRAALFADKQGVLVKEVREGLEIVCPGKPNVIFPKNGFLGHLSRYFTNDWS